ncbi:MAG: lipoyl synthase [Candidatus Omnitrophica bacterium]|nr:lipoyl synthase [Candidatus Omnitrophota bacterium]
MKKPSWLNKKLDLSLSRNLKTLLKGLNLHSVCEEALCPNISECFGKGVAAFMILGNICTRDCKFCGVRKGIPAGVDLAEPGRVKEAVKRLRLEYVVITSPTRDDLEDAGANIFCLTVKELKTLGSVKKIEILIPDFLGRKGLLEKVLKSSPNVVAHNLETVPSIYSLIRSKAYYERSLKILKFIKEINPGIYTKSAIMLGLGEKDFEVRDVLRDLIEVDCDFLSIGQYLPPSKSSWPLKKCVSPEEFKQWQDLALKMGFRKVLSAPYVRSSYLAHTYFNP